MSSKAYTAAAVAPLVALTACGAATNTATQAPETETAVTVSTISAQALAAKLAKGEVQLIDVRMPEEFEDEHIEGAINIPLDTFDPAALPDPQGKERVLYCRSGRRSGIAGEKLAAHSGAASVHLDGGIIDWMDAGLPVVE